MRKELNTLQWVALIF